MDMSERLKHARKNKGYTQRDIAKILNVKPTTVSAWEVGRNEPSISMLKNIARVLGTSFEYLAGVENNENEDKPLTKNQKLVAYSIDPGISDEERRDIIEMVKIAMKNRRRV